MATNSYSFDAHLHAFAFATTSYPIVNKISSFKNFDEKWHYGEGVKFKSESIKAAIDLCLYLYNNLFTEIDAFPGLDGEIMIKCYSENTFMEIFLYTNSMAMFTIENADGDELFNSSELSLADLKKQILSQRLIFLNEWNLSVFYPSITTTKNSRNLPVSPSKTRLNNLEAEFPSSLISAQLSSPELFVSMFEENTASTPTLQYSGSSTLNFYRLLTT